MIRPFKNVTPQIDETAFVAEMALVMGDVIIGAHAGVFPGAIVRGDFAQIKIGDHAIIEDNCVVHSGTDMEIGEHVIVGHGAVVHGGYIGCNTLIANNATVLDK